MSFSIDAAHLKPSVGWPPAGSSKNKTNFDSNRNWQLG